jgi:hypothetical protein
VFEYSLYLRHRAMDIYLYNVRIWFLVNFFQLRLVSLKGGSDRLVGRYIVGGAVLDKRYKNNGNQFT